MRYPLAVAAFLFAVMAPPAGAQGLTLVRNGASDYVIVLAAGAGESEKWAAEELAAHLKQMSGAVLKVVPEGATVPAHAIVIGEGAASRSLGVKLDAAKLGTDGFVLKTAGARLVIAGGRQRGTMYGVYELLAGLGCRWWAPGASTIPQRKTITLAPMDVTKVPALEYRDMLYGECDDPGADVWSARNRINGRWFYDMPEKLGGKYAFDSLAHTFGKLVPAGKYFKDHPEYYALRNGRRSTGQLCLSNPELVPVVADALMKIIAAHPEYHHVTFGQDDNRDYCECDNCQALYKKYGARSGAMLDFTNKVAALIKPRYPNVWVNTMAYEWSRQPPVGIAPADNVMITLCSIECNFAQPLAEGTPEENAAFIKDAEGWAKIAPRVFVWDYTTNFVAYLAPFPNTYSLAPNIRFYVEHSVRGLFEQGSHTTHCGQFAALNMWVEAQAMWNPQADGKALVREFCLGYYGPKAGPMVLSYLDLLHDRVTREKLPAYATHRSFAVAPYLAPDVICRGEQLFEQAEDAVKDDPELLRRVQVAHIPIQYMLLRRPADFWAGATRLCPGLTWEKLVAQFTRVGRANKISQFAEGDPGDALYQWSEAYARLMAKGGSADLPAELKGAAPGSFRYFHAAQMDQQVRFLHKVPGASDGWAQQVVTYGWAIQHKLAAPFDFTPGKTYRLFVRAQGKSAPGTTGGALEVGIYVPQGPRCSRKLRAEELSGEWRTYEIGTWKAPAEGGTLYLCLDMQNEKQLSDVFFDGFWLQEVGAGG